MRRNAVCLLMLFSLLLATVPARALQAYVLWADLQDPFSASVRAVLDREGEDFSFVHLNAVSSQWAQLDQVQEAIDAQADAVLIQLCEYGALSAARTAWDMLDERGIPAVFFGRRIASSPERMREFILSSEHLRYVHFDEDDIGKVQGAAAATVLAGNYSLYDRDGDGAISCVILQGDAHDAHALARTRFALESANALLTEKGFTALTGAGEEEPIILSDPSGAWSAGFARDALAALIRERGLCFELVLCGNDDMANGAVNALYAQGYNTDLPGCPVIPVFGVDGTETARQLISRQAMAGSVIRSPENLAAGMLHAARELTGSQPPAFSRGRCDGPFLYPAYALMEASFLPDAP